MPAKGRIAELRFQKKMANLLEQASEFTKGFFAGGISITAIAIFLAFLWVQYPDNVKIVLSQIWYILSFLFKKWAGRRYVKTHLEGTLGKQIEKINKEVHGLDADKIKIVLVQHKVREAFIKEKTLIIRLEYKENHYENLVNVAVIYAENFLYRKLELHLDDEQRTSINLYTAKSLLKNREEEALQFLHKNCYLPVARDNENIQAYFEKLEKIDNKGLFYGVFVQEMVFLGNKVYFKKKPVGINNEVKKFVDFLEDFVQRERGETDIKKTFSGTNIKVAFVLVALKEKRELGLLDNYVHYVETILSQGIESIYAFGWGTNISFVNEVATTIKNREQNLTEINRLKYRPVFSDGGTVEALCVLFRNKAIAELQDYTSVQAHDLTKASGKK